MMSSDNYDPDAGIERSYNQLEPVDHAQSAEDSETLFEVSGKYAGAADPVHPYVQQIDNPPTSRSSSTPTEDTRPFEDLTLAELTGYLLRSPRTALSALVDISLTPDWKSMEHIPVPPPVPGVVPLAVDGDRQREAVKFSLYLAAFIAALWGNRILISAAARNEALHLNRGAPYMLLGFVVWLVAEIYGSWPELSRWWQTRRQPAEYPRAAGAGLPPDVLGVRRPSPIELPLDRIALGGGGLIAAVLAWLGTSNNEFSFIGFWSWVISIALVTAAFAPAGWSPAIMLARVVAGLRSGAWRPRSNPTLIALVAIMLVGAVFRFANFSAVPPEMTSDHVEKLLDSQRVAEGQYNIFFVNNGGREPFQMYAMALLSRLPGLGMNFDTLKLLSVIEGLATLPVLWIFGREIVGERDRRLGNVVGLILAALVAASYWHTALSRLSLRIVLTPLVASALLFFLARGMRHNRRGDFLLAGLVLGLGLYTYQAVRMLPVVVVLGVMLAALFNRRNRQARWRYVGNLMVLVGVSFIVFIPMFRFSTQYPQYFWMRTAGRLLGDDVIQTTDEAGNIVMRSANIEDRMAAFRQNFPVLTSNIRNALLMYNWKGDVAWINGAPNFPAMDIFTGSLLIVGLAAWIGLTIRSRDPVLVLIPIMILIMLLPSALSIAYPVENPSATRTSGSLPPAYLIAALPLGLMALSVRRLVGSTPAGTVLASGLVIIVVLAAYGLNSNLYFGRYREAYENSSLPYREPGQILRGFALSDGSYGNAFMIAYDFWWDHRAVGIEAGIIDWPNGILTRDDVPDFLYQSWQCATGAYRLNPERDLLFFYNKADAETAALLTAWFPDGRATLFPSYQMNDEFYYYRVPAPGADGMQQFVDSFAQNRAC